LPGAEHHPLRVPGRSCVALALAITATLVGCAVGPSYHRPAAPADAGFTTTPLPPVTSSAQVFAGDAQHFIPGQDVSFDWWRAFGSDAVNSLVEQAFRANPTVPAAQATLRQAQELVYAQRGYFYPSVTAGYSFERQMLEGNTATTSAPGVQGNGQNLAPSAPAQPLIYNFQTAALTVGFTPDVFGSNRRKVESLEAQAQIARFELEATYVTLASNVVAAAIQEASLRAQLASTRAIIDLGEKSLQIMLEKYQQGYATRVDVAAEEAQLAQLQALLPPLEKQLEQTRDLLRALTGRLPNQDLGESFELASLKLPQDLPLSVPAKIIEQRPDVRAAAEQIRSANAEVGVAVAAMIPQFSITGAVGGAANQFDWMFRDGGPFWSLIAGVSQPLFAGGTLLHTKRAADQALLQAAAEYRQAVLAAYQNVADTLHALLADADELAAAYAAERAAKVTLDLTLERMHDGFSDYLSELAADTAYEQAVVTLIQAQATRFGDTAALYQALGGGWWNRTAQIAAANHPR
jgi:NodT family efflux transporter outer membrane factor (OMF) lipoprotein